MITFARFNPLGNHSGLKHLVASIAKTLANGLPYAFRKPAGRSSIPGAFHGVIRLRIACISSGVTSQLILMPEFKGRALFGGGLASGLGKKRCYSRVAFS